MFLFVVVVVVVVFLPVGASWASLRHFGILIQSKADYLSSVNLSFYEMTRYESTKGATGPPTHNTISTHGTLDG